MKRLLVFALVCALLCPAALADVQSQVNANSVAGTSGASVTNNETLGRTNSTLVQSVNDINDTSSESGMGFNVALNIILIAVGFVIILLAIAILIRVR